MRALVTTALVLAACAEPVPLIDAGTPVPNRCAPTPDDVDFGVLPGRAAENRTILVRNPTQGTLFVEVGQAPEPFLIEAGRFKIAAGQQQPVKVSVQTTDSRSHFARVSFSGGLECAQTSFLLSATSAGQLTVSPLQLDFGAVGIGEVKTLAVVLTNSTDHDVALTHTVSTNPVFTVSSNVVPLAPRQSTVVQVEARPDLFGTTQAVLVLEGADFSRAVPLQVQGGRALAQLEPEVLDVPLVPFFAAAPEASFVTRTLLLRNLAPPFLPNASLRITGPVRVEVPDGGLDGLCVGRWTAGGCTTLAEGTIAGGQALEVPVRLAPTSEGPKQWLVTVPTNDALAPNQQVLITAHAGRPEDCQLDVSPRALVLGTHPVGEAGSASLTFHNTGATPCLVDSLALVSDATLMNPDGGAGRDGGFVPVSPVASLELDGGSTWLVIAPGADHVATIFLVGRLANTTIAGQVTFHVLRADSGVETVPFMMRVQ